MSLDKKRDNSIDLLKGIGMITVVLYHCGMKGIVIDYFTSFHMMLFFFVSGYCCKKRSLSEIFKRKAQSLLLPYFMLSITYTVLNLLINTKRGMILSSEMYIRNIFISSMAFGAVWFLSALFIATCLGSVIIKFCKRDSFICIAGIGCFFLAIMINDFSAVSNYLRFEQGLIGASFFVWGAVIRKRMPQIKNQFGVLFLVVGLLLALCNGKVVVSRMQFGENTFVAYFSALLTILGLKWVCEIWSNNKFGWLRTWGG